MSLTGNEIIRLTRQGQVEIGGAPLTYVAGDVPLLDAADLAGLNPTLEQARKVSEALTPIVNKELERFGVKIMAACPSRRRSSTAAPHQGPRRPEGSENPYLRHVSQRSRRRPWRPSGEHHLC